MGQAKYIAVLEVLNSSDIHALDDCDWYNC
jgi:hypothetical protein